MPRKKCAKTDAYSSPSAKGNEFCLTEEEIQNIIPAVIWEKQQETLKRAGLSPPEHLQLGVNQTTAACSNHEPSAYSDCDSLLQCLEDADFLLDEEQGQNLYRDFQEGRQFTSMWGNFDEGYDFNANTAEETTTAVTQSPPSISRLRLDTEECDEDLLYNKSKGESQGVSASQFTEPQNEEKTTTQASTSSQSCLPKRFFIQEDQIPVDDFCSDSDDDNCEDDDNDE